jgi:hypothetical protein
MPHDLSNFTPEVGHSNPVTGALRHAHICGFGGAIVSAPASETPSTSKAANRTRRERFMGKCDQ